MILDHIHNSHLYTPLHPLFEKAFAYLKLNDFKTMPPGKYEIEADDLFALVSTHDSYSSNDRLEAHKKYIDIQYLSEGTDVIGWKHKSSCLEPEGDFDESKDVIFYRDKPEMKLQVTPGNFAIFYPWDTHAPLMGSGSLIKVVIKVKI